MSEEEVEYFESGADFRRWLEEHHEQAEELWVGFFKKATGKPSQSWSESVDEALCFGWIDGIRRKVDEERYKIRFTPRRPRSVWSAVNLKKMEALKADGRMTPTGLAALDRRTEERSRIYAYERKHAELGAEFRERLEANEKALAFWQDVGAHNKKAMSHWVMSAKRESTRERRFSQLLECAANGELIPSLRR